MPHIEQDDRDEQKEIIKEAIKEWLDEMFATFGKWSAAGIGAALLAALAWLLLTSYGWKPPHP